MHVSLTDFSHALLFCIVSAIYRAFLYYSFCFTDWKQASPSIAALLVLSKNRQLLSFFKKNFKGWKSGTALLFPCVFSLAPMLLARLFAGSSSSGHFLNYDLQFIVIVWAFFCRGNRMAWILTILFERTYGKGMACPCQYRYHLVSLALSLFLSKWHRGPSAFLLHRLYRRKLCI